MSELSRRGFQGLSQVAAVAARSMRDSLTVLRHVWWRVLLITMVITGLLALLVRNAGPALRRTIIVLAGVVTSDGHLTRTGVAVLAAGALVLALAATAVLLGWALSVSALAAQALAGQRPRVLRAALVATRRTPRALLALLVGLIGTAASILAWPLIAAAALLALAGRGVGPWVRTRLGGRGLSGRGLRWRLRAGGRGLRWRVRLASRWTVPPKRTLLLAAVPGWVTVRWVQRRLFTLPSLASELPVGAWRRRARQAANEAGPSGAAAAAAAFLFALVASVAIGRIGGDHSAVLFTTGSLNVLAVSLPIVALTVLFHQCAPALAVPNPDGSPARSPRIGGIRHTALERRSNFVARLSVAVALSLLGTAMAAPAGFSQEEPPEEEGGGPIVPPPLTGTPTTYTVDLLDGDSGADDGDAAPGDGVCAVPTGGCSLRAAVDEADATTAVDRITFARSGQVTVGSRIDVGTGIDLDGAPHRVTISGGGTSEILYLCCSNTAADQSFSLRNLTIADGYTTAPHSGAGGVFASLRGTIENVTFVRNRATAWPGGALAVGGPVTVVNSTFVANAAPLQLGGADIANFSVATVRHSSFLGAEGGSLLNNGYTTFILESSAIKASTGFNCRSNAIAFNGGGNISSDGTCPGTRLTDPGFEALRDVGAPTDVLPLAPTSAAIDAAAGACPATDQRGAARPSGPACDVGAFEALTSTRTALSVATGSVPQGGSIQLTAAVSADHPEWTPAGTVQFFDGATVLSDVALVAVSTGVATATLTVPAPDLGERTFTATFVPALPFAPSSADPATVEVVSATPTVTLTGDATSDAGTAATFAVSVEGTFGPGPAPSICSTAQRRWPPSASTPTASPGTPRPPSPLARTIWRPASAATPSTARRAPASITSSSWRPPRRSPSPTPAPATARPTWPSFGSTHRRGPRPRPATSTSSWADRRCTAPSTRPAPPPST